jgi:phosphohistidine swiveling domain-containing protein
MDTLRWPAVAGDRTGCVDTPRVIKPETSRPIPARQLWGNAISGEFATGRVRHVDTVADAADLGPDDVAVCHALTPALTAHLGRVAAVIAEAGSPLGAGATLLRECGVPAVVAPGAWTHLRPGQRVVVDGIRGTVWIGARLTPTDDTRK